MAGLNAGDLDREITLQTAPYVTSETGEKTLDWASATDQIVWAQWVPTSTSEGYQSQHRLESLVDGVFRIYDMETRPTPDDTRILFDGRVFDIKPYVEIERGQGLEIAVIARGE